MLKKKWKYLRDQYSTELSKITRPKSGAGADEIVTCKWQYFTALSFLKDIVRPRQSSGNCSTPKSPNTVEHIELQRNSPVIGDKEDIIGSEDVVGVQPQEDNAVDDDDISRIADRVCETEYEGNTPQTHNFGRHTTDRIKRRRTDDYTSSMLEIERKKLELLSQKRGNKVEKEPDDEHSLYFKTLLPHVRKISPEHILPFRASIQEVVQQFAYPMSYSVGSTPRNSNPLSPCGTSNQSASMDVNETTPISANEAFQGLDRFLQLGCK